MSLSDNGIPDDNERYTGDLGYILYAHYFPDYESIYDRPIVVNLDGDRGANCRLALERFRDSDSDTAMFDLDLYSPKGNRDDQDHLGKHSVALVIDKKKRRIIHQDPYGLGIDEKIMNDGNAYRPEELAKIGKLRPILEEVFPGYDITEAGIVQQQDRLNCLPLTINNLVHYARYGNFPKTVDIAAIRREHREILQAHFAEKERINAQKVSENMSGVATQMATLADMRFSLTDDQYDEIRQGIKILLNAYYAESKNGCFSRLVSEQDNHILTELGDKLANRLLAALVDNGIISVNTGDSFAERVATRPEVLVDFSKMENEQIRKNIYQNIKEALVLRLDFGTVKRSNRGNPYTGR